MWALKWGAKFGPRFGVRRIVFSFRGPQNGVQILGPSLGSTLPVFFLHRDGQKGHPRVGCLWAGSFASQAHCRNWGGPCSGRWFLVRFSDLILGSQDNGFIQERGVVAGTRVGVVILVPVFLGALVAVFLVVLVFFGRYLGCNSVPGQGLDSCVVVWLSFFVAVLVGPFVAVLVVVFLFAFV